MMHLLDTNVVSELRKVKLGKTTPQFAAWANQADTNDLYLSVITLQELEIGVLLLERKDPIQGKELRAWLNKQVLPAFEGRILPITLAIAQYGARFHVPNPHALYDGLIAATAHVHGMTIVTRNVKDFESTNASILNPWKFTK